MAGISCFAINTTCAIIRAALTVLSASHLIVSVLPTSRIRILSQCRKIRLTELQRFFEIRPSVSAYLLVAEMARYLNAPLNRLFEQ